MKLKLILLKLLAVSFMFILFLQVVQNPTYDGRLAITIATTTNDISTEVFINTLTDFIHDLSVKISVKPYSPDLNGLIIIAGHGIEEGMISQNGIIPWENIQTEGKIIAFASCYSQNAPEGLGGLRFPGLIDASVAGIYIGTAIAGMVGANELVELGLELLKTDLLPKLLLPIHPLGSISMTLQMSVDDFLNYIIGTLLVIVFGVMAGMAASAILTAAAAYLVSQLISPLIDKLLGAAPLIVRDLAATTIIVLVSSAIQTILYYFAAPAVTALDATTSTSLSIGNLVFAGATAMKYVFLGVGDGASWGGLGLADKLEFGANALIYLIDMVLSITGSSFRIMNQDSDFILAFAAFLLSSYSMRNFIISDAGTIRTVMGAKFGVGNPVASTITNILQSSVLASTINILMYRFTDLLIPSILSPNQNLDNMYYKFTIWVSYSIWWSWGIPHVSVNGGGNLIKPSFSFSKSNFYNNNPDFSNSVTNANTINNYIQEDTGSSGGSGGSGGGGGGGNVKFLSYF